MALVDKLSKYIIIIINIVIIKIIIFVCVCLGTQMFTVTLTLSIICCIVLEKSVDPSLLCLLIQALAS